MSNQDLPPTIRKAQDIIQSAQTKDGWMSEAEHNRVQAEWAALGITVVATHNGGESKPPVTDEDGWTFFEVSVEPFVEQIADENGEPMEGDIVHPNESEYRDEFGDELDGYPDAMFLKGWTVCSWVRDCDGDIEYVDGEEHLDYDTAIAHAEELAKKYNVPIAHLY